MGIDAGRPIGVTPCHEVGMATEADQVDALHAPVQFENTWWQQDAATHAPPLATT